MLLVSEDSFASDQPLSHETMLADLIHLDSRIRLYKQYSEYETFLKSIFDKIDNNMSRKSIYSRLIRVLGILHPLLT